MVNRENKKVIAIIQARMNSDRLPGKVMLDLAGKPVIHRVIDRVKLARQIDEIWLATSNYRYDDILGEEGRKTGVAVYRGSLDDVLERFYETALLSKPGIIVRVTADNPLTAPEFINRAVKEMAGGEYDYVHYSDIPYGSGIEAFNSKSLFSAHGEATEPYDREHVTPFIRNNPAKFKIKTIEPPFKLKRPDIRVTLDTLDDYLFLNRLFNNFIGNRADIPLEEVISYIDSHH